MISTITELKFESRNQTVKVLEGNVLINRSKSLKMSATVIITSIRLFIVSFWKGFCVSRSYAWFIGKFWGWTEQRFSSVFNEIENARYSIFRRAWSEFDDIARRLQCLHVFLCDHYKENAYDKILRITILNVLIMTFKISRIIDC